MAKTCPSCGYNPIGPFTDNCPICAEPVRNVASGGRRRGSGGPSGLPPVLRWLAIGALAATVGVVGCCGLGWWRMNLAMNDVRKEMEEARAKMETERRERTVTVPAGLLMSEFQTDAAAAEQRYKGKYLEVTGIVERVGQNGEETPFVILYAGDEQAKLRIECFFEPEDEAEEERIEKLAKGQLVVVRGEYAGRVSNVQMRGCVLGK